MNVAVVLAGGVGSRMRTKGGTPKQFLKVEGKPIICYCIEKLSSHVMIDAIQIVADVQWRDEIAEWMVEADVAQKWKGFSNPGENRQLSIYNGLSDIKGYADDDANILIHDAARPLISEKMITDCMNAMEEHEGVLPVLPMKDTVYLSSDGKRVGALLKRNEIFAGQAPEAFKLEAYYEANRRLLPTQILSINGSTEPAVLAGLNVAMIQGDEQNFKITTMADLDRFRSIVKEWDRNSV